MPKPSDHGAPGAPVPHPIDLHVGMRLRLRRVILGLRQDQLGDAVGVSLQQIQKYERGQNRVSASRLFDLARVLGVPIDYFFRNPPVQTANTEPAPAIAPHERCTAAAAETRDLVAAYWNLSRDIERHTVLDLLDTVAQRR